MTPLAWSVVAFTLKDWVFIPGHPTVGNIAGLPYLNISVFATLFHFLGKGRQELLDTLESTIYMRLPDGMEIPRVTLPWWGAPASIWLAAEVQIKQKVGVQRLPAYLDDNPGWFERTRKKLEIEKNTDGLRRLWLAEIMPHVKRGVWTVLGIAKLSSEFTNHLRHEIEQLVGSEDALVLISNLSMKGKSFNSQLLPSLGPLNGISRLVNGGMTRQEYLAQFGHRGPNEFEISLPRPAEDPLWLDKQISQFKAVPVDPEEIIHQRETDYIAAWEHLAVRYPEKMSAFQKRLDDSARLGRLREKSRSEYVRDRWMVRLFALRAGELSGIGEDVFFLTLDELLELLAGNTGYTRCIPERKEMHRKYRAMPGLPGIIRGRFEPFSWANDPDRRSDIFDDSSHITSKETVIEIKGSPGSAGQVEGRVRVITNPAENYLLQPGEILVTVQTDITWTLVFPRAVAVVTDVGAPLSHAAIVARELGIPAVVGCGNATMRLKTGDRVHVDGARGVVQIL